MITAAQLVQSGLTYSGISKRAANGRLHRRYARVYAVGQPRLSQQGEWMAATLACGPGAYLASFNAAVHMEIWRRRVTGIHVLMPRGRRTPRGVQAHTYRRLDPRDVTVRNGIPVTTVPRTLVDLSDVLTAHQLANVIHEAAFRKLFDERAVRAAMHQGQRPPQPPRPEQGTRAQQGAAAPARAASSRTASSPSQADPACPNRSSTRRSKASRSTSTGPN